MLSTIELVDYNFHQFATGPKLEMQAAFEHHALTKTPFIDSFRVEVPQTKINLLQELLSDGSM